MESLNDLPVVSILMPAYNAEGFLDESIRSVLNQTYKKFELLIADDASVDRTRSIIDSYKDPRIRTFYNETNMGYLHTCNFLYEKAQGEIMGFQDADDVSHVERLEKQVELILKDENSFCGCNMQYMNYKGKLLDVVIDKSAFLDKEFPRIGDSTLLIFKSQVEKVGGLYRSYFANNQDYDLGLRLLDFFKYKNLNCSYYYYRNVPYSNSKNYTSAEKVINGDLVRFLAKDRRTTGSDFLINNDMKAIESLKTALLAEYELDKSMMERRAVSYLLSIKMYGYAFTIALQAIKKDPSNILVYRALFYVFRKFIGDKLNVS